MVIHDINQDKQEAIVLIHPMNFSGQLMIESMAKKLGNEYRYIVSDLSGHGKAKDNPYISTTEEAATLACYLKEHDLCTIKMAFGASLGGGVLFELVKDKNLHIQKLFFEGTSFFENAGLISKMLGHVFLSRQKKARQDPQVVISQVAKRYGKYAKLLVDTLVSMDKQSIRNIVYDCGHIRLPRLLEDRQKEVIFSYGDKDPNLGHAKRSIKKHYPKAEIKIWQSYGHCEEMTQNTEAYLTFVKEFLDSDLWNEKDKS